MHVCVLNVGIYAAWNIRGFSGPHSPALGLKTKIYSANLCIQSKCGKIPTRKTRSTDFLNGGIGTFTRIFSSSAYIREYKDQMQSGTHQYFLCCNIKNQRRLGQHKKYWSNSHINLKLRWCIIFLMWMKIQICKFDQKV